MNLPPANFSSPLGSRPTKHSSDVFYRQAFDDAPLPLAPSYAGRSLWVHSGNAASVISWNHTEPNSMAPSWQAARASTMNPQTPAPLPDLSDAALIAGFAGGLVERSGQCTIKLFLATAGRISSHQRCNLYCAMSVAPNP